MTYKIMSNGEVNSTGLTYKEADKEMCILVKEARSYGYEYSFYRYSDKSIVLCITRRSGLVEKFEVIKEN